MPISSLRVVLCSLIQDVYGMTALHAAVLGGHTPCVQYLLWLGADPDQRDRCGVDADANGKHAQNGQYNFLRPYHTQRHLDNH